MTDLTVVIALQDPQLEDEALQDYTQNLLPQIRNFDGVEAAGLVPQDQPVNLPGMTAKDFGAFILGAITFIATVKTVTEIVDWVEKRWLKPKESQLQSRKLSIEITTPDGYKLTCTAEHPEDLKVFLEQVHKTLRDG